MILRSFTILLTNPLTYLSCKRCPIYSTRSATVVPARVFGLSDSLGTVAPGWIADFVLLAGNPLVDIEHVRRVTGVVLRGEYLDRPRLDALVDEALAVDGPAN